MLDAFYRPHDFIVYVLLFFPNVPLAKFINKAAGAMEKFWRKEKVFARKTMLNFLLRLSLAVNFPLETSKLPPL